MKKHLVYIYNLVLCATTACALSSCGSEDYSIVQAPDGTVMENPGVATVNINGTDKANTFIKLFSADGEKQYAIKQGEAVDLEAGTYSILAYHTSTGEDLPQGAAISKSGAISLTPTNGILPDIPAIEAAIGSMAVISGDNETAALDLHKMTRELAIKGTLNGVDVKTIKSITATMSGVATGAQITRSVSSGSNATVSKTIVPASDGTFKLSFNMLGIDTSSSQNLSIAVTFTTGSTFTYDMDATSVLKNFNAGSYSSAAGLNAEINFAMNNITATISPWNPGWNQGGTGE